MKALILCLLFLSLAMSVGSVLGQEYKIIVPGGPGSTTDIIARVTGEVLGNTLIINKPGAGGVLGAQHAAQELKDGVFFLGSPGSLMISPLLLKSLPYDPNSFVPIFNFGRVVNVLVARSELPYMTEDQVILEAKRNPGKLNIGVSTAKTAPHISTLAWMEMNKIDLTVVPYTGKGLPAGIIDLLGGRLDLFYDSRGGLDAHIESGKLRVLAASTSHEVFSSGWLVLMVAADTPEVRQAYLNVLLRSNQEKIMEKLKLLDLVDVGGDLAATRKMYNAEKKNWENQIKLSKLQPE